MARHRRNKSTIEAELKEQRLELNASVIKYDSGVTWEAKRIASSLYKICYDGRGRTKSLLTQLGIRENATFLTTAQPNLSEDFPVGLLLINLTQAKFVPISSKGGLHEGDGIPPWGERVPFEDWWSQRVFIDQRGRGLTREKLISAVRSQDGGAHYDEYLRKDEYFDLVNYDGQAMLQNIQRLVKSGANKELMDALLKATTVSDARNSSIRQIAFETEFSLHALEKEGML